MSTKKDKFSIKDQLYMELALDLAKAREGLTGPNPSVGCVIVKKNKIISEGSNKVTSSNDPTAHAEVVAIREACKKLNTFNLTGCDLYTSCEPCPMCLSAIYWSHIDNIFYANTRDDAKKINFDDSLIYSEISKKNEDRKIPIKQMMRSEALKAFELWDKKIDKIEY